MPIKYHGFPPDTEKRLRGVIDSSPTLQGQIKEAHSKGNLDAFVNGENPGAAATYDPRNKTIEIGTKSINENPEIMTLNSIAHETHHALRSKEVQNGMKVMDDTIQQFTKSKESVHDYTHALKTYIDVFREDEARAMINGWNVSVEALTMKNEKTPEFNEFCKNVGKNGFGPFVTLNEKNNSPVDFLPGIKIEKNLLIDAKDEKTVALVGMQYFSGDIRPKSMGPDNDRDYPHIYLLPELTKITGKYKGFGAIESLSGHAVRMDLELIGIDPSRLRGTDQYYFNKMVTNGQVIDGTSKLFKGALHQVETGSQNLVPPEWSGEQRRMLAAALAREAESAKLTDITSIFADAKNPKSIFAMSSTQERTYMPVNVEDLKPLNDFIAKPQTVPQQDAPPRQTESKCVIF